MKLGYYPGCALEASSKEYGMSIHRLAREVGIELCELEDWSCCGASAGHSTNFKLSVGLSWRNLLIARKAGLTDVFAPCPLCAVQLKKAVVTCDEQPALRQEIESIVETTHEVVPADCGAMRILNCLEFVSLKLDDIAKRVDGRLKGLKVACYYGCLLVRPPKVMKFDDCEQPESMEKLVKALGAEPVDWEYKLECCGAGLAISKTEAVIELSAKILKDAKRCSAQAVVVACQMCQANLDIRQRAIEKKLGIELNLPVIYLPQLAGLAMGIEPKELGLNLHMVDTGPVLRPATAQK